MVFKGPVGAPMPTCPKCNRIHVRWLRKIWNLSPTKKSTDVWVVLSLSKFAKLLPNKQHIVYNICYSTLVIFFNWFGARLTASVLNDLRRLCFIWVPSPTAPCVKCLKEEKYGPLLPFSLLYIPRSKNNFVKHAKPLKSLARDWGSCAAPEPGRCKGREDLCNSGLVLPRVHTHTQNGQRAKKRNVKSNTDWINNIRFTV